MRRDLFFALVVLVAILGASSAFAIGDCSSTCTNQSSCSMDCIDGSLLNTCGGYGVCYVSPDSDNDGVYNYADNCQYVYNPSQANCDGDSAGDACDSENGNFSVVSVAPCYIKSSNYWVHIRQTRYWEGLYRDSSSCNSPDEYRSAGSQGGSCTGFFWSTSGCCVSLWGGSQCSALLQNNQCSY